MLSAWARLLINSIWAQSKWEGGERRKAGGPSFSSTNHFGAILWEVVTATISAALIGIIKNRFPLQKGVIRSIFETER